MTNKILSICIATFNRGGFIGETLDSILSQISNDVELVVVDGASPDNTSSVMAGYLARYPDIRYYREKENSGIDRDYDKVVSYATGQYCWLMTDDDLLTIGSIARVLESIEANPDLIVVNSKIKNADLTLTLEEKFLKFSDDRNYTDKNGETFFSEIANYLSFIGGVIIKRTLWLERDRSTYYGTLFIHVGVIFQHPPITRVKVISDPLITIRYGNAMWTARGFEIWMFKWPHLIWSFPDFLYESKLAVVAKEPWKSIKKIILYRAIGGYSKKEYNLYMQSRADGIFQFVCLIIAMCPATVVNLFAAFYCAFINKNAKSGLYDIARSNHASFISRLLGKNL